MAGPEPGGDGSVGGDGGSTDGGAHARVGLVTIAREWGRIGVIGFGGPPAHIALLRDLCVTRRRWLGDAEFTDAIAVVNLLPGPASTQLAIWCAHRLRGRRGALVGGVCFIVPGLLAILALSALFLASSPPRLVLALAAGAGAAVPAVALHAAASLVPASWRSAATRAARIRWVLYLLVGGVAAATAGPWVVVALLIAGLVEMTVRTTGRRHPSLPFALPVLGGGTLGALAWTAAKVGALSYGGGFVIIPLMQHDAVDRNHWMTAGQFLTAVALGQVTPGPVVLTVAAVGFAAAGVAGALMATVIAFAPSFAFVMAGASHFEALRSNARVRAFLAGAGPAAIGAIAGATIPLVGALSHVWQLGVLAAALLWLLALRKGVVPALVGAAVVGALAVWAGAPL